MRKIEKLVVCGVGLIGGSVALALRQARLVERVVGIGRRPEPLAQARQLGVIDEISTDWAEALDGADMVLLAMPVGQMETVAQAMAPHLGPNTVVTDAGSTKRLGELEKELADLRERGMLKDTLVIWGGEFGRTPAVELPGPGTPGNGKGRDHNHWGFTVWLAGGGVRGGYVHGATDEFGFRAVEKPVHVHDLHATMLQLMGINHERLTYRYAGRDFRLTDVAGEIVRDILA